MPLPVLCTTGDTWPLRFPLQDIPCRLLDCVPPWDRPECVGQFVEPADRSAPDVERVRHLAFPPGLPLLIAPWSRLRAPTEVTIPSHLVVLDYSSLEAPLCTDTDFVDVDALFGPCITRGVVARGGRDTRITCAVGSRARVIGLPIAFPSRVFHDGVNVRWLNVMQPVAEQEERDSAQTEGLRTGLWLEHVAVDRRAFECAGGLDMLVVREATVIGAVPLEPYMTLLELNSRLLCEARHRGHVLVKTLVVRCDRKHREAQTETGPWLIATNVFIDVIDVGMRFFPRLCPLQRGAVRQLSIHLLSSGRPRPAALSAGLAQFINEFAEQGCQITVCGASRATRVLVNMEPWHAKVTFTD